MCPRQFPHNTCPMSLFGNFHWSQAVLSTLFFGILMLHEHQLVEEHNLQMERQFLARWTSCKSYQNLISELCCKDVQISSS